MAHRESSHQVREAARSVLPVPGYLRAPWRRGQDLLRLRAEAHRAGARRVDARRRLRCARVSANLLRDLDGTAPRRGDTDPAPRGEPPTREGRGFKLDSPRLTLGLRATEAQRHRENTDKIRYSVSLCLCVSVARG